MLRITTSRSAGRFRFATSLRPLHSSIVRLNVTNVPPSSVPPNSSSSTPGSTSNSLEKAASAIQATPVTPSTPSVSSSSASAPPPPPPPQPPKKKGGRFRRFLITTTLFGLVLYGGGLALAVRNDNFHDFFTEFIPFGETIVMYIEEREFQRRFPNAGRKPLDDSSARVTVPRGGATWRMASEEYKGPSTGPHVSAVSKDKSNEVEKAVSSAITPATPKPVKEEPKKVETLVVKEKVLPKLPKFVFDGAIDPSLESVVKAINGLFNSLSSTGSVGPDELSALATSLGDVSKAFVNTKEKFELDLKTQIDEQSKLFASQLEKTAEDYKFQVKAVDEKWKDGYFTERKRILEVYKNRLATELKRLTSVYNSKLNNEVLAAVAGKEKEFSTQIVEAVENERNGRLSKLNDVKSSFEEVISISKEVDVLLSNAERTAQLQLSIGELKNALGSRNKVPLAPILARIKEIGADDLLISSAIAAVPVSAYDGVLSPAQLADRFKMIEPEIRKASLVPDDAGVAGFFGSWLFSKLLWKKDGKPLGNDVESILARTENALLEGNVVEAVKEANSLEGWCKKLAADWLTEGRKRSEIEFLTQVLGEEGKIWQYEY
ncbi:mitochondrial inner membrane protein-domain-containing protein [Dipodascopsis uninucleata]